MRKSSILICFFVAIAACAATICGADDADPSVRLEYVPFNTGSPPSEMAPLASGFSADLRDALSALRGRTVTGLTSTTHIGNRHVVPGAVRERGKRILILRGRFTAGEDGARIEAALFDGRDGRRLWSGGYEAGPTQILTAKNALLDGIARVLDLDSARDRSATPGAPAIFVDYLRARGLLALEEQQATREAWRILAAVRREAPGFVPGLLWLAETALRLSRDDGALSMEEAVEVAGEAVDAAFAIEARSGAAFRLKGDIAQMKARAGTGDETLGAEARTSYERAIELDPADRIALSRLGAMLFRDGAFDGATPLLQRASRLDPGDLDLRMLYARAARAGGHVDEARQEYLGILGVDPRYEPALVQLGYLERQVGRLDASATWFERGAASAGGWYNHVRLAVTYTDLGDLDGMRRATGSLGGSFHAEALGDALRLLFEGRFAELIPYAEARIEDDAENEELWRSFAGSAAIVEGEPERGLEHFRAISPELFETPPRVTRANATEAIWVAFALREIGTDTRAERIAGEVLGHLSPPAGRYESSHVKPYRMAVYAILGRLDEALAELRAAIDHGSRTILYERFVRYEDAPMFRRLHDRPDFTAMIAEIKGYNASMLAAIRGDGNPG